MRTSYFLGKLFLILYFTLNLISEAEAQTPRKTPKWRAPIDTTIRNQYIARDRRSFTLFIFLSKYNNGIMYRSKDAKELLYQPITPLNIGLGFTHKLITIGVSVVSPYLSPSLYGEVKSTTFQITAYGKRFGAEIFYYGNTGYRLTNNSEFLQSFNNYTAADIEYPNLGMIKTGANILWVAHPEKYSLKASTNLMERQKRNAQSFLVNMTFTYMSTQNGDSSFVSAPFMPDYAGNTILTKGYFFTFAPTPGYGMNWRIRKNFFYDLSLSFGPAIQYQNYFDEDVYHSRIALSYMGIIRTSLGYHGKKWVTSISWLGEVENYPLNKNTSLLNHVGKFQFRIGYKFGVPKWARSYSDKLDDIEDELERHMPH